MFGNGRNRREVGSSVSYPCLTLGLVPASLWMVLRILFFVALAMALGKRGALLAMIILYALEELASAPAAAMGTTVDRDTGAASPPTPLRAAPPDAFVEDLVDESADCHPSQSPLPEEWCFRPQDSLADATGFIVIRDIPKTRLSVDGVIVELEGGFRGFAGVPPGVHTLISQGYDETFWTGAKLHVHPGGCVVLRYDHDTHRLARDESWGSDYASKAVRGVLDSYLYDWPNS